MKRICFLLLLMIFSGDFINAQGCSTSGIIPTFLFAEINGSGNFNIKVRWIIVDDGNTPSLTEVQAAIDQTTAIYSTYGINLVTNCNQPISTIYDPLLTTIQGDGTERELCNFTEYCESDAINIFFMRDDVELFPNFSGIANIGGNKAVIRISNGVDNWRTLIHEMGHCFGLFHPFSARPYTTASEWDCEHPFEETFSDKVVILDDGTIGNFVRSQLCNGANSSFFVEWEKVNGSNSTSAGDFVADTPAQMSVVVVGGEPGTNVRCDDFTDDCSDYNICDNVLNDNEGKDQNCHKYEPDWNTYMGYRSGCQDHFTPGQVSRMKGLFASFLNYMVLDNTLEITQNTTISSPLSAHTILIKNGATLTIKDTEVAFKQGGFMSVGEGCKLILDNSTLTSCGDSWSGIICNMEAESVEIENQSLIENAKTALSLKSSNLGPAVPVNSDIPHPTLMMTQSTIQNCDIGIQFGKGQTESRIEFGVHFLNNRIGILYHNHSGLVISNGQFTNNETAIHSIDGYMQVKHFSLLFGNDLGIHVEGSLPMASGIQIGDNDLIPNLIQNSTEGAIFTNGSEHPASVVVSNASLGNNSDVAFAALGANDFSFQNNEISDTDRGAFIFGSGSNFNKVNCNVFEDIDFTSSLFMFQNDRSNILENTFMGTQTVNIGHISSGIPTQGLPTNPAANCFSDPSLSAHIVNIGFLTAPPIPFIYHYYNEGNDPMACQDPIDPNNYTADDTDIPGDNCAGNVGVFGLISTDGGGSVVGLNPQTDDPNVVCTDCIRDVIEDWIDIVVSTGGDDPTTIPNEENLPGDPSLPMNEAILNQWVNYALYVALETNDIALAEQVLIPMTTWYWKTRLYGLYALRGDYSNAKSILSSLSEDNANQVQFKQVQEVNMKRMKGEEVSTNEVDMIHAIALGHEPASGYARTLYGILTGIRLPIHYPELGKNSTPRSSKTMGESTMIYPNPSSEMVFIEGDISIKEIRIVDISGKQVLKLSPNLSRVEIDMSTFEFGIYIFHMVDSDGRVETQKVMKL